MSKHIIQIIHDTSEPFLTLSGLYARALRQLGYVVTNIYIVGKPDDDTLKKSCADENVFLQVSKNQLRGLKFGLALHLRKLLRERQSALVIAQRYKPTYLALLATLGSRIPVIGVAHAFGVLRAQGRRFFLRAFAKRLTLLGVSRAVTANMSSHAPTLKIKTLHNAIDIDVLEMALLPRDRARQQLGIENHLFVFGNVGRLHADKDQPTLIRAFARIAADAPQARLLLIGKGKTEAACQALAASLGVENQVIMLGAVPAAAQFFAAFDVYVSASNREPFGMVLAEAMLAKLPVISTDCGGAPEVLGDIATYFSYGDDDALAQHMQHVMQMSISARQAVGQALHLRVNTAFAPCTFTAALQSLLNDIMHVSEQPNDAATGA